MDPPFLTSPGVGVNQWAHMETLAKQIEERMQGDWSMNYRVRAYNFAGTSGNSNVMSLRTVAGPTPTATPTPTPKPHHH